jgi:hypothetical protein
VVGLGNTDNTDYKGTRLFDETGRNVFSEGNQWDLKGLNNDINTFK